MNLTIRPLKSAEDGRHLENITMDAWGCHGLDAIPSHLSLTVAKENGGVILLAFDEDADNLPIGFCWGFWAYMAEKEMWKCASHQAGVITKYKGKGIGAKIKWAQRDFTLDRGFNLMTWTFDPLETANGSLNIRKLGAICNTYHVNLYGELDDDLNRGIETDRFSVDWWLDSDWVEAHKTDTHVHPTVESVMADGGLLLNQSTEENGVLTPVEKVVAGDLGSGPRYLLMQVPRSFQSVKRADLPTGVAWRTHTRKHFTNAFANGYSVVDLILGDPVCHYLFEKNFIV